LDSGVSPEVSPGRSGIRWDRPSDDAQHYEQAARLGRYWMRSSRERDHRPTHRGLDPSLGRGL